MNQKIHDFIEQTNTLAENLTDDEFIKAVTGLLSIKKQVDMNLSELKNRMHCEIIFHDYIFDRKNIDIKHLENMLLPENIPIYKPMLIKMFKDIFMDNPRKLTLQMIGPKHKEEQKATKLEIEGLNRVCITDINEEEDNDDQIIIPLRTLVQNALDKAPNVAQPEGNEAAEPLYYGDFFKSKWLKNIDVTTP
jgi:hypothetical protein